MTHDPRKNAETTRGRPFSKGNAGRPPGARNKTTLAIEALMAGEATALSRKAVDLALEGDVTALRMCLDRLSPPKQESRVLVDLPDMQTASDHPKAIGAVIKAMSVGDLSPGEAEAVCRILDQHRKAIETADLEARIAKLEQTQ
jgi:hypothetical protein